MSKISISIEKYTKTKTREVEIDGVSFVVRKPGAGEQLDALENVREINNLKTRMELVEDEAEKVEIVGELSRLMIEMENSFVRLFDDGTETQKKSKELIRKIGIENVNNLMNDIFGER